MSAEPIDAELARRLAALVGLSLDAGRASEQARLLAAELAQVRLLEQLDLEGVQPACSFELATERE